VTMGEREIERERERKKEREINGKRQAEIEQDAF
jgi:hypothetical protein